jgi:hypothetical protein
MPKQPSQPGTDEPKVRTSFELPEALWLKAKHRALEERTDLRALVIEGLEYVLTRKPRRPIR